MVCLHKIHRVQKMKEGGILLFTWLHYDAYFMFTYLQSFNNGTIALPRLIIIIFLKMYAYVDRNSAPHDPTPNGHSHRKKLFFPRLCWWRVIVLKNSKFWLRLVHSRRQECKVTKANQHNKGNKSYFQTIPGVFTKSDRLFGIPLKSRPHV